MMGPIVPSVPGDQAGVKGVEDTIGTEDALRVVPPCLPEEEGGCIDPDWDDQELWSLERLLSGQTAIRLKTVELGPVRFAAER